MKIGHIVSARSHITYVIALLSQIHSHAFFTLFRFAKSVHRILRRSVVKNICFRLCLLGIDDFLVIAWWNSRFSQCVRAEKGIILVCRGRHRSSVSSGFVAEKYYASILAAE